jgi:hypothetical protein
MDAKMKAFILKVKAAEKMVEDAKMKTKRINFEDLHLAKKSSCMACQATNMNGKQCTFRAVCGKYCRKHKI